MKKQRRNNLFKQFFESEKSGGLTLIFFTLLSLFLANTEHSSAYVHFWEKDLGPMKIEHWVNDVLMSIFFLLIGLELKREFKEGELSSWKNASLPIFSALGGMIVPALIFIGFNFYQGTITGFGIPMATDIAFALGILSLLGNRVPLSLKIFLTALAVIDDLGAVLVIAIFYTSTIVWLYLGLAVAIFGLMLVLNKLKVVSLLLYLPLGILMWYFMHHSGVHSTIAGVLFAFALPSEDVEDRTDPSELLQKALHIPVPYIILPVFALANTAIPFTSGLDNSFVETVGAGVFAGLVLGKPLGIFLFAFAAVKLKLSSLPNKVNWTKLIGVGILGGIGFTMSIFVTMLAFEDEQMINKTKIIVLVSSLAASIIGLIWLRLTLKKKTA
jgi:NhaA family Na+:H+ antiporter